MDGEDNNNNNNNSNDDTSNNSSNSNTDDDGSGSESGSDSGIAANGRGCSDNDADDNGVDESGADDAVHAAAPEQGRTQAESSDVSKVQAVKENVKNENTEKVNCVFFFFCFFVLKKCILLFSQCVCVNWKIADN